MLVERRQPRRQETPGNKPSMHTITGRASKLSAKASCQMPYGFEDEQTMHAYTRSAHSPGVGTKVRRGRLHSANNGGS